MNKGLKLVRSEFVGWLGSDDFFSKSLKSSEIIQQFEKYDILVYDCAHIENKKIKRITPSWPIKYNLNFIGLNNAHFSTFGKTDIFTKYKFSNTENADIDYFLKVFNETNKIKTINKVSTYMSLGGHSTRSFSFILKNNLKLIKTYSSHTNLFVGSLSPFVKILFKVYLSLKSFFSKDTRI